MKVAITGSSGLIGTALTASLQADGHQVVRLVRRPPRAADEIRWDPRAADAGNPVLTGVSACVHLAGAGVGDHRWTAAYKAEIRSSRVLATRALATALVGLSPRPATFIVGSAIGWYGDTGGAAVTEDAPAGKAFPLPGGGRLGGRRLARPRRRHPRRPAAQRPRPRLRRRHARAAGAAGPPRRAAPVRRRPPGDELDLADRRDPRDPLPARRRRRVRPQRPLQPHRAQPGHQRGADLGAARRLPAPRLLLAARPRPGAQAGPGRDVSGVADQRPGAAEAAAGRWLRVRATPPSAPPSPPSSNSGGVWSLSVAGDGNAIRMPARRATRRAA